MQVVAKSRAGAAPAIIREGLLRPRYAMNDAAFRNCILNGIDATAAFTALCQTPGRLILPDFPAQIILTSRIAIPTTGLEIDGGYSLLMFNGTNVGLDFNGGVPGILDSGISNVKILGSVTTIPTTGSALTFSQSQKCYVRNVRMERVFNGINVSQNSETILDNVHIRDIHGTWGIRSRGESSATGVYGLRIYNCSTDAPYLYSSVASNNWRAAMGRSTFYNQGDIATAGGAIYQCQVPGYTDPATGPGGSHGTPQSRLIQDGSVTWQFVASTSLAWLLVDSFAYTTTVFNSMFLNGAYGVRMVDNINNGTSFPYWLDMVRCECDHSLYTCVDIAAGKDFSATARSWFGSALVNNGVSIGAAYKGGGTLDTCCIRGNAQEGVLLDQAAGFSINNCDIGSNSASSYAGFNNISVASNVSGFQITNNRMAADPPNYSQNAGYPIVINAGSSEGFVVRGNLARGHTISNLLGNGASGPNQDVADAVTTF